MVKKKSSQKGHGLKISRVVCYLLPQAEENHQSSDDQKLRGFGPRSNHLSSTNKTASN